VLGKAPGGVRDACGEVAQEKEEISKNGHVHGGLGWSWSWRGLRLGIGQGGGGGDKRGSEDGWLH
jgi:hypothetical protein